jgi:hypothetical protein
MHFGFAGVRAVSAVSDMVRPSVTVSAEMAAYLVLG